MPVDQAYLLTAQGELMMRQCHPTLLHNGRPWSGIFTPTSADSGHLSADRGTLITAKAAYENYLAAKQLAAAGGTWAVTVGEFDAIGLPCYRDPIPNNNAHATIDFTCMAQSDWKSLGKRAFRHAFDRGCLPAFSISSMLLKTAPQAFQASSMTCLRTSSSFKRAASRSK